MAIDPSIPLGVQPLRLRSPLESLMAVQDMRLRQENALALRDQREALAEQRRAALAAQEREAAEEATLRQRLTAGPMTLEDMAAIVGPERAAKIDEGFMAVQTRRRGALASGLGAVEALPAGMRQDAYADVRRQALANGWATDKDLPETYAPEIVQWALRRTMNPKDLADASKPQGLMNVPAGGAVFDPVTGKAVYTAPTKPPEAPAVGSFEDYLQRVASEKGRTPAQLSPKDIEDARRRFNQADDRPPDPLLTATRQLALEQARANAGRLPARQQTRVDSIAKGFDTQPIVKRAQTMAEAVNFVQGMSLDTQNPSDDQALIYAFAKAMDPDSVVREGEYATVQRYSQSWAKAFGKSVEQAIAGTGFLSREARQNIRNTIQSRFNATKQQYDNLRSSTAKKINQITGQANGEDFLTDYGGAFPGASSAAAPGGGGRPDLIWDPKTNSFKKPGS